MTTLGSRDHSAIDRFELLLFSLGGLQRFGMNVLKVKEVMPCPRLTQMPNSRACIRGVASLRGENLAVIDLSQAVGRKPFHASAENPGHVIVTEFNRVMVGFLVQDIHRIVILDWKDVLPPPGTGGGGGYITGVVRTDEGLIQILDVEKVLVEAIPTAVQEEAVPSAAMRREVEGKHLLVVDDSSMARKQLAKLLDALGARYDIAIDGKQALQMMLDKDVARHYDMVISDIEMPEMDGYSLTREIRNTPELQDTYVLLHTSLSGEVNTDKARRCGSDDVLTKFAADELLERIQAGLARC